MHTAFLKVFTSAEVDTDEKVQNDLQARYHSGYRNGIGESIQAMVTCRPDIALVTVKCTQQSTCPVKIHYQAAKHAMKYLVAMWVDAIYY